MKVVMIMIMIIIMEIRILTVMKVTIIITIKIIAIDQLNTQERSDYRFFTYHFYFLFYTDDDDYVPSDYYLDDEDEYEETDSHDIHHTDGGDDVSGSILGSGKKRIDSKSDGVELVSLDCNLSKIGQD